MAIHIYLSTYSRWSERTMKFINPAFRKTPEIQCVIRVCCCCCFIRFTGYFFVSPDKVFGPPGLSVCCLVTHSSSPVQSTDFGTYFTTRYIKSIFVYTPVFVRLSLCVCKLCLFHLLPVFYVFIFHLKRKQLISLFSTPLISVHSLPSFTKLFLSKRRHRWVLPTYLVWQHLWSTFMPPYPVVL